MFLRSEKTTSKLETVVGPATELEGDIRTNESIRIDGKVKGGVTADCVIIGQNGVILGDISANKVTVGGRVKGNISASSTLELLRQGQILGDIRTHTLVIADGATFEGNCQMLKSDGQIVELPSADGKDSHKLKVIAANSKH